MNTSKENKFLYITMNIVWHNILYILFELYIILNKNHIITLWVRIPLMARCTRYKIMLWRWSVTHLSHTHIYDSDYFLTAWSGLFYLCVNNSSCCVDVSWGLIYIRKNSKRSPSIKTAWIDISSKFSIRF